ncbi:MAG: alpha/beta hydrolase, partial [Candidatus Cloacimonetes bacterium]|nr:alpha/beta hydrolase [Candidatus Cloacimonadota bacterium]
MKTYFILLLALVAFCSLAAADITGDWHGMLDVGGQKLRIVFHIRVAEAGLSATMDSPDQNAFDLPMSEVSFTDQRLELALDFASITYT